MAAIQSSRLIVVYEMIHVDLDVSWASLVHHRREVSCEEVLLVNFVNAACPSEELQYRFGRRVVDVKLDGSFLD